MNTINAIKIRKPIPFAMFVTSGFIGERFIVSMRMNNNRPPSSAGNGKRFMIARLMEIIAVRETKCMKPSAPASLKISQGLLE